MSENINENNILDNTEDTQVVDTGSTESPKDDFLSQLPEELRNEGSLQDIKSLEAMAQAYVSSQRMLGNRVKIPTEDSSKEDWDKFYNKINGLPDVKIIREDDEEGLSQLYNKLGRPEDPSKYKLPEGLDGVDEDSLSSFKEKAHKLGITNKQFEELLKFDLERQSEFISKHNDLVEQSKSKLKEFWGNEYQNRIQSAKITLEHYSEKFPEVIEQFKSGDIGNNPAVIYMLSEMGQLLSEKGVKGVQGQVKYGKTREEFEEEYNEILGNTKHPFYDYNHPSHKDAVRRVHKLAELINPTSKHWDIEIKR